MYTTVFVMPSAGWAFQLLRFAFYLLGIACMLKFLSRR